MIVSLVSRFHRVLGYWPNLLAPKTFNEKVLWRLLFDRRASYAQVLGKFESREFLRQRLRSDELLVPLVGLIRHPSDVYQMNFPDAFMLKINDGSQLRRVYRKGEAVDLAEMAALVGAWLSGNYGKYLREWGYRTVAHAVIVEHFIGADDGTFPIGLKLNCFDGRVHSMHYNQYDADPVLSDTYDQDWNWQDIRFGTYPVAGPQPRPAAVDEAIRAAELLSAGFDHMRVDFHVIGDRVKFGELTMYYGAGLNQWQPDHWDRTWGAAWRLPKGVGPLSALLGGQPDVQ